MMTLDETHTAHSAFEKPLARARAGAGVLVRDLDGVAIATLALRRGAARELTRLLRELYDIDLKFGPYRSGAGGVAFHGVGAGAWLLTSERGGNRFSSRLREQTAGVASVCDQSDAFGLLRLSGSRIRETLCKLVPIDVHPKAFRVDDVAATVASHMGVTLWRLEDDAQGPVFELAVARSMARSLWEKLSASAAEFGIGE